MNDQHSEEPSAAPSWWRLVLKQPLGRAGLTLMGFFFLFGLGAPWWATHAPEALAGPSLQPPDGRFWLGTNDIGQDLFSQFVYGTRQSLFLGLLGGLGATVVGVLTGVLAGFASGPLARWTDRLIYVFLAIPDLPLMLLVAAWLGPGNANILLVIILLSWPVEARIIRAQAVMLRQRPHIEAARFFGAGLGYLLRRHVLTELFPLMLSGFILQSSRAFMLEAGLAFLGLGDPTAKSWGMIIRHALNYKAIYFTDAWLWWLLPPGLAISLVILSLNWMGFALEALADRRLEEGQRVA